MAATLKPHPSEAMMPQNPRARARFLAKDREKHRRSYRQKRRVILRQAGVPDLEWVKQLPVLIRQWRIERLVTQAELAALVGVRRATVIAWEQGRGPTSFKTLKELRKLLGHYKPQEDFTDATVTSTTVSPLYPTPSHRIRH